jgi:fatty acid hydroxylase domain-containing protein 2
MGLWATGGEYSQAQWEYFLESTSKFGQQLLFLIQILDKLIHLIHLSEASKSQLWVNYVNYVAIGSYWVIGLAYLLLDLTKSCRKYKVQPGTNEPLDYGRLVKVIGQVLFNQFVITIPTISVVYRLSSHDLPDHQQLPTFATVILHVIGGFLIREVTFYYSHRLLHAGVFYKYIHKQHHEFTSPIGISAMYCHPVEHVISNYLPSALPISVLKMHVVTTWIWLIVLFFETITAHSGYHLPFLVSSEFHDFHHFK